MKKARSQVQLKAGLAVSNWLKVARYFLMKLVSFKRRPRSRSCVCFKNANLSAWAENRSITTNVRVIVATNRDLPAAIAGGTFREDRFYRFNVFPIEIPPLRERRE